VTGENATLRSHSVRYDNVVSVCTFVRARPEVVFDFTRDVQLHTQTTRRTGERIVRADQNRLELNDEVTFEAVHFGVRQRLTARIVEYDPPHWFVDEMVSGAFQALRHEHEFRSVRGGTLMIDTLRFTAPFGTVGSLAGRFVLRPYMLRFLLSRNASLKRALEAG